MTLASIISRIEAGETGRELEAEIALAVGAEREGNTFWFKGECFVLERDYYDIEGGPRELPAYLTDLNAAVSLVPIGATWTLLSADPNEGEPDGPQPPFATVVTTVDAYHAAAPTPAAALTCAALKARIEQ